MKTVSIVAPFFNEKDNVELFHQTILNEVAGALEGYTVECIYVDDGSNDGTGEALAKLSSADERVRVLRFSRNFGHQAALTAGLSRATGEAVITMDSDLQDPPSLVPEMVLAWEEGAEIVYARRKGRSDRFFKKWSADLYYRLLSKMSDVDIPRQVGDFRLLDRRVLQELMRFDEHDRYLRGMIAWMGFRHAFVDFDRPERLHGETHYPLHKMIKLAMDGLLNFTFSPLKAGLWVGLASIFISCLFLVYMVVDTILSGNPELYPLYKWLVVILFGFVGGQFMFIWILGEYIGRIYNDVRRRPLYIVREQHNLRDDDD